MTDTVKRTRGKVRKKLPHAPNCPKCSGSGRVFDPRSGRNIGGQTDSYRLIPCPRCQKKAP